jgi:hypothetical protein
MPAKSKRKANRGKVAKKNAMKVAKSRKHTSTVTTQAPLSGKKARKLERKANHARKREIEKTMTIKGEVAMTGT